MKRICASLLLTAGILGSASNASAAAVQQVQAGALSAQADQPRQAAPSAAAQPAVVKRPLPQIFDQLVIVPYDYHGKVFVDGEKTNINGNYPIADRNGRVLVPIRLMSTLVSQADHYRNYWDTQWNAQHPNDVLLVNAQLHKTVKFTVGSKTMLVNNQPVAIDVAPQLIGGRIMLPLRSASEALGKHIDWLNGLILIGNAYVDLQDSQTLAIRDEIKAVLADSRQPADAYALAPITQIGNTAYYYKRIVAKTATVDEFYRRSGSGAATRISLPGNPQLDHAKLVNGKLYYLSIVNNEGILYAFDFSNGRAGKIATIGSWSSGDGWLADVRSVGNQLYVVVHRGDLTMGSETLYAVDQGKLTRAAEAKSFIRYERTGNTLYYTDFTPMFGAANNLKAVDLQTGAATSIGVQGFAYGMNRTVDDQGGTSYSGAGPLVVQDGYLYTLGYQDSDPKALSAVYRINPADQTQTKLTAPTHEFWPLNNNIYYIDASSGSLMTTGMTGGTPQTLVQRSVANVQFVNGEIYYTASADGNEDNIGQLYRYDPAAGKEVRLSANWVSSYYVGQSQIYYVAKGYRPGIYKVDANGHTTALVRDDIGQAVFSDSGVIYTLAYKEGIFSAK